MNVNVGFIYIYEKGRIKKYMFRKENKETMSFIFSFLPLMS